MTPDEVRQAVSEKLPDYIQMLDRLIRNPPRNAQTQLSGIKLAMSLVVPTVTAATITGSQGGPVEITLRMVKAEHKEA